MTKLYYHRSQVQTEPMDEARIAALMYFLWGVPFQKPEPWMTEAYKADVHHLKGMAGKVVDLQLTLEEVKP